MKAAEVFLESLRIRDALKAEHDIPDNPIDISLLPILPYKISSDIQLIIIGQDPTIQNEKQRRRIEYTLNLDKPGALRKFISSDICTPLGIEINNIYATNVFKYFYTEPPQKNILEKTDSMPLHIEKNLELLRNELSAFPEAVIITLGEPVLKLLNGYSKDMKYYWDHKSRKNNIEHVFAFCAASENVLGRDFFPFVHQPSMRNDFYKSTNSKYIAFIKSKVSV